MKSQKKRIALPAFVKKHGPTAAAALCGVSAVTIWRWATLQTKPHGNDARRLEELGVRVH